MFSCTLPLSVGRLARFPTAMALLCAALVEQAHALPAMTAYSNVTVIDTIGTFNCPSFAPCGRSTGYANHYADTSILAGPVITTSVDTPGWSDGFPGYDSVGGTLRGEVSGKLIYTFAVVGPTPIIVPVTMIGAIYLDAGFTPTAIGGTGSGYSKGHAYLSIADNYPGNPHYVRGDAYSATCDPVHRDNCNTGFTLTTTILSSTPSTLGEVAWVELAAGSSFSVSYGLRTFASATVDPLVSIDPVFLSAHPGYSLVFADGLSNQIAAVPESGTSLLMIAGLCALMAIRSKK